MTILNYACTPSRAILAVDSIGVGLDDGSARETSKALIFPAQNMVLAARGSMDVLAAIFHSAQTRSIDFDQLAAELSELLPTILKGICDRLEAEGKPIEHVSRLEFVLIGWSKTKRRICPALFTSDVQTCTVREQERMCAPGDEIDPTRFNKKPFAKPVMLELMRSQLKWATRNGANGGFGGRMVYVDIQRDTIVVDSSHKL